jgi:hypothetical protein
MLEGRDDIQQRQLADLVRPVERQPVGDAGTAIVAVAAYVVTPLTTDDPAGASVPDSGVPPFTDNITLPVGVA